MLIYYIGVFMLLLIAIITYLIRRHALRKKSVFIMLFNEALRQENNGDFRTALMNYKKALMEANKMRYDYGFRNKILEKLKLLHTVINYDNSFTGKDIVPGIIAGKEEMNQ